MVKILFQENIQTRKNKFCTNISKNNFYDILPYNNYENKNLIINNILNLEDNYFIEIKNKLLAIMYCYLTEKKLIINLNLILNFY